MVSGDTDSGLGVMTAETKVLSNGNSLAMALVIMSLKPKIPTSKLFSTIKAAFRASAIISPTVCKVELGLTMVDGFPARTDLRVGDDLPPRAWANRGPKRACNAAA